MRRIESYIEQIKRALSGDLLKPEYKFMHDPANPTAGHCYHAAEALYHMMGGKIGTWVPMRVREDDGMTHWWLRNKNTGEIGDPTADQYTSVGLVPPYECGRAGGFLTAGPSKRAAEIIRRVQCRIS
jgi:hypothetical protein